MDSGDKGPVMPTDFVSDDVSKYWIVFTKFCFHLIFLNETFHNVGLWATSFVLVNTSDNNLLLSTNTYVTVIKNA